jgi:hypothetical protein
VAILEDRLKNIFERRVRHDRISSLS